MVYPRFDTTGNLPHFQLFRHRVVSIQRRPSSLLESRRLTDPPLHSLSLGHTQPAVLRWGDIPGQNIFPLRSFTPSCYTQRGSLCIGLLSFPSWTTWQPISTQRCRSSSLLRWDRALTFKLGPIPSILYAEQSSAVRWGRVRCEVYAKGDGLAKLSSNFSSTQKLG